MGLIGTFHAHGSATGLRVLDGLTRQRFSRGTGRFVMDHGGNLRICGDWEAVGWPGREPTGGGGCILHLASCTLHLSKYLGLHRVARALSDAAMWTLLGLAGPCLAFIYSTIWLWSCDAYYIFNSSLFTFINNNWKHWSRRVAKLAQSRPPPVRTHAAAVSPPPLSPRTSEKKHHSRRKSGKDYASSEKKSSSRPAALSRKTTPQFIPKAPSSGRAEYRHRDRDDEERGRDSGESFPQFCMTCEKQFLPANNTFLYCSEACRLHDQAPPPTLRTNSYSAYPSSSPPLTPYSRHFSSYPSATPSHEDGPDIIPRFSPTQSRPRSYFNSDPYPSYQAPISSSPPPRSAQSSSTALASLRELATALPKTSSRRRERDREPESPPKSSASSISRTNSGVWNYIPFAGSKTSTPTPSATPGNSYTQSSQQYNVSQSYGTTAGKGYATTGYTSSGYTASGYSNGRSREDLYNYGKSSGAVNNGYGYTASGGMGMDRPLPPRSGPGGYGHRPRSIDLVTPFSGH
ncbi:hypothetical protein EG329_005240 [Mollisiaceae sp. DMI_Dod_QoI]|nr:hypothetical protein EG329_005240 [Helotiales sp. DMI_Dod_QoI]